MLVKVLKAQTSSGAQIINIIAPLIEPITNNNFYLTGIKGVAFTAAIDARNTNLPRKAARLKIYFNSKDDIAPIDSEDALISCEDLPDKRNVVPDETDEEVTLRVTSTFETLSELARAAADLKIRSLIVSGTPGTGKTYEVLQAMKKAYVEKGIKYSHLRGTISPVCFYMSLYENRDGVLILDDTDKAFEDNEMMLMLKAATESEKCREVSYVKLSGALADNDIPTSFEFNGCVIILTNVNLEEARKSKQCHYDAIISRAHYINAVLSSEREKMTRINHVLQSSKLLRNFLEEDHHSDVVNFLNNHSSRMRELSIRSAVKLAELRSAFPDSWCRIATTTLLIK